MGIGLSLLTLYEMARTTTLQLTDMAAGRVTRESCDRLIHDWATRVIERARIHISVSGVDAVPPGKAFVYMSNHQSHLDIPVLYMTIPARTLRMVAKRELFRLPGFGPAMRAAEFIEVNRESREQAIASLRRAEQAIADGVSIWIAPEGTRSRTGELGPLKKGGFHLASAVGAPIVPIAINGTIDILPADTRSMNYDVPVTVEFGPPIPVAGRDIDELMTQVGAFLMPRVAARRAAL
jgi:1-acyl-sn-glycerol-3-phosphate acyltransferase